MQESEEHLQSKCFAWHWNTFPQYRRLLFHVPNGGLRNKKEAAKFKAVGVVAGIADFIYLYPRYAAMIELKTETGTLSSNQEKVRKQCKANQIAYFVVRSLEEFKEIINSIHSHR